MIGEKIGHYEITDKLGEGGMGVVYKAEDQNLHRPVALKFLRADALGDQHLHGRFWKEAEVAAALDHPNIPTIHEISEEDGQTFIAMAFIEGESLAEKIKQRPLPLDEALGIASQVGEALQVAHERGIVHRDIKPGNIMITPDGRVKVMDFGLAHLAGQTRITKTGTVMGTPAYMSPEQAEGQELDRRSDIWSLAIVLYEMVTGQLPFKGDTDYAVLRAILDDQPEPMTAIRVGTPPELDRIVAKALEKKPEVRYQTAADVLVDLRRLTRPSTGPAERLSSHTPKRTQSRRWLPVVAIALLIAGVAAALVASFRSSDAEGREDRVIRFEFASDESTRSPVISPDGRRVAYVSGSRLWIRELARLEPIEVSDVGSDSFPFWSPDSEQLAYFHEGALLTVPATGGRPTKIASVPGRVYGGVWAAGGTIVVARYRLGLQEVPAGGGELRPRLAPDSSKGEFDFHYPHLLPDGTLLCATHDEAVSNWKLLAIRGESRSVITSGKGWLHSPTWSPTGHILYHYTSPDRGIWAVAVDEKSMTPVAEPFLVEELGSFASLSTDGTLAYVSGLPATGRLVITDRTGQRLASSEEQPSLGRPSVSPDGRRIAAESYEDGNWDIWIYDIDLQRRQRFTFSADEERDPAWSPMGDEIVYWTPNGLMAKSLSGDGVPRSIAPENTDLGNAVWSPRGDFLSMIGPPATLGDGFDIWYAPMNPRGEPVRYLATPHFERYPTISPNGRFVAYFSAETLTNEVYVRSFPAVGEPWIVSTGGGRDARWSPQGDELFYVAPGSQALMSAKVELEPSFRVAGVEKLFEGRIHGYQAGGDHYDVLPGGERFVIKQAGGEVPRSVVVVDNWQAEFQGKN
jgi:eukaryotic-like serine/threonine-protein kinase